jgi:hypothetical protein
MSTKSILYSYIELSLFLCDPVAMREGMLDIIAQSFTLYSAGLWPANHCVQGDRRGRCPQRSALAGTALLDITVNAPFSSCSSRSGNRL